MNRSHSQGRDEQTLRDDEPQPAAPGGDGTLREAEADSDAVALNEAGGTIHFDEADSGTLAEPDRVASQLDDPDAEPTLRDENAPESNSPKLSTDYEATLQDDAPRGARGDDSAKRVKADGHDRTVSEEAVALDDATIADANAQGLSRPAADPEKTISDDEQDAGDQTAVLRHSGKSAASDATLLDGSTSDDAYDEDAERTVADELAGGLGPHVAGRGHRLDRFEIRRVLGEGAFGVVYQAYDPKLDRLVAIKVAKTGVLVGRSDVDRFLREARSAAQLRHPNIVPVYEVVQSGHTSFIAYEFVEGRNFKHVLRERGRISQREAARLLEKLARALHYAHAHGIVHRDVKPENILLDKNEEPHILDFGIARRDEGAGARTLEGALLGTPAYMSPEQASGQSYKADARSDVWSLGIMLNEMLTGALPFRGTITDILVAVTQHEAKPLRQFDPSISKDLETICQKCLAKNPAERFQSAEELADELERWLKGEPILSRRISVPARVWRWACRNPLVASLITAIVVISLTLGTVSGVAGFIASREAGRAREEQRQRTFAQVSALLTAQPDSVPVLMQTLEPFREDVLPRLDELQSDDQLQPSAQARLRLARLVLGREDEAGKQEMARRVLQDLLHADAGEFLVVRQFLEPFGPALSSELWKLVNQNQTPPAQRFRAASALAEFDPQDARWEKIAGDVAGRLLTQSPGVVSRWMDALAPVRDALLPHLKQTVESADDANQRYAAAAVIDQMFADRTEILTWRLERAEASQLALLMGPLSRKREEVLPLLKREIARPLPLPEADLEREVEVTRRANAAVALLALGDSDPVLPMLSSSHDNELRTAIIHRVGPAGVDPNAVIRLWQTDDDPGRRIALLQSLSGFGEGVIAARPKADLIDELLAAYREDPNAGVHSTIRWLLERWGENARLDEIDNALAEPRPTVTPQREWLVNSRGQTFAAFRDPVEFQMGSPPEEEHRQAHELLHRRRIDRDFAICTREITVSEFFNIRDEVLSARLRGFEFDRSYNPTDDCPALQVNWYDAAKYCRWLSEQEGFTEEEMCYPPIDKIGPEMVLPTNLLERTGYRLPTSGEWEYACRAGTITTRYYGKHVRNLDPMHSRYAWCAPWSGERAHPVGSLKPNDFGLFDVYGNAMEWSQSWYFEDPTAAGELMVDGVVIDGRDQRAGIYRELRGGTHDVEMDIARSAERDYDVPMNASFEIGFRLARTLRPSPQPENDGAQPP